MPRRTTNRIDPWSRWADFTMASWECWFEAYCKPKVADAPEKASEFGPPSRRDSLPSSVKADARFAGGLR